MSALPVGITSDQPMPYKYRRCNGVVWCDAWVDHYNEQLARAITRHRNGSDATWEVDALYRMAHHYDALELSLTA